MEEEINRLANEYQFFHWHLEFPDVFRIPSDNEDPDNEHTGLCGGFDCVLGNPPWEHIELKEKEFFAATSPEIADARTAAIRKRMIQQLKMTNAALYEGYESEQRKINGITQILRESSNYPFCGRGRINTYAVFGELNRNLINPTGCVGCIVQSGIATDDTTKFFFQDLMNKASLVSLYDFENREKLFPEVDSRMKFCLLTLTGSQRPARLGAD